MASDLSFTEARSIAVKRPGRPKEPGERSIAMLLNSRDIKWLYEPDEFPINWDFGMPVEFFRPDFYLPVCDTYLEVTTSIRSKSRKIAAMRTYYPKVRILFLEHQRANANYFRCYDIRYKTRRDPLIKFSTSSPDRFIHFITWSYIVDEMAMAGSDTVPRNIDYAA